MDSTDDAPEFMRPGSTAEEFERQRLGEPVHPAGNPYDCPCDNEATVDDAPQTIRFVSGMPFDEQVVGPDGETRGQARTLILKGLEEFRDEVIEAQRNGRIDQMAAFRMRLQIHREKCALVGLGIATYPQAF